MMKFFPNEHLNISNYLYDVESALQNRSSGDLSDSEKKELRLKAGLQ